MDITPDPELEAALREAAQRYGLTPEVLALKILRERFLTIASLGEPRDHWERKLREAATDCRVTLSDEAIGRESMYD